MRELLVVKPGIIRVQKMNKIMGKSKMKVLSNSIETFSVDQYLRDQYVVESLYASERTKNWIRDKMYELRMTANKYECEFAKTLSNYGEASDPRNISGYFYWRLYKSKRTNL